MTFWASQVIRDFIEAAHAFVESQTLTPKNPDKPVAIEREIIRHRPTYDRFCEAARNAELIADVALRDLSPIEIAKRDLSLVARRALLREHGMRARLKMLEERAVGAREFAGVIAGMPPLFDTPGAHRMKQWSEDFVESHGRDALFVRASGEARCELCSLVYADHPTAPGYEESCPTMTLLCNGRIVKL